MFSINKTKLNFNQNCGVVQRSQRVNKELAFPGNGREALTFQQQKIRGLEKKLKNAEMERDILKKAMVIFSRASK